MNHIKKITARRALFVCRCPTRWPTRKVSTQFSNLFFCFLHGIFTKFFAPKLSAVCRRFGWGAVLVIATSVNFFSGERDRRARGHRLVIVGIVFRNATEMFRRHFHF